MDLETLKKDWEYFAESDPLWAILTDERKAGGKWDVVEFMATGEAEIEFVLNYLGGIGLAPDFSGAALDFGCGVGRLTQPLARRFASCVGLDISKQMIRQAESFNQYSHCRYVVSSDAHLPFGDASFAFVYSNIVLQHVPPRFVKQYLREFVRVLAPSGILLFGLQDSFAEPVVPLLARARRFLGIRTRIRAALKLTRPEMQMNCLPERMVRRALGSARVADIQFTNSAAADFNGKLVFLEQAPTAGFISKQYCVVKQP